MIGKNWKSTASRFRSQAWHLREYIKFQVCQTQEIMNQFIMDVLFIKQNYTDINNAASVSERTWLIRIFQTLSALVNINFFPLEKTKYLYIIKLVNIS